MTVIGAALVAALIAGGLSWWWWGSYEVVAELRTARPPVCTQSALDRQCGDGVIVARTGPGPEREFRYTPDLPGNVVALPAGSRVVLTIRRRNGQVVGVRSAGPIDLPSTAASLGKLL